MSQKSFYKLCDLLRPYLEKKRTRFRTPITVEAQEAHSCVILATKVVIEKPRMLSESGCNAYQGVRNVSFLENFAYVLNG